MKKQFLTLVGLLMGLGLFAQNSVGSGGAVNPSAQKGAFYLGLGTGINSPSGMIGLRLDAKVTEKLMLGVAAGIGSWGTKVSANAYFITPSNWCPMIGIGHTSGIDSIALEMGVQNKAGFQQVPVQLKPVNVINLGVHKQWFTKRGNRLFLELGYSVNVTNSIYRELNPVKYPLTAESRQLIRFMSPGGLIASFGVAFRL